VSLAPRARLAELPTDTDRIRDLVVAGNYVVDTIDALLACLGHGLQVDHELVLAGLCLDAIEREIEVQRGTP
jgi:hypothetical protein